MEKILNDVGRHHGTGLYTYTGDGHYEATFESDGSVKITTVFDVGQTRPAVTISPDRWDRLVAWVEWRRKDITT
jgi:hypothetical protein